MTVPTNTPRGSYGPKGDTPPVVPWLGVAAAPPAIPKLYWDAYSDEQRIKALWACFNGLADRVNQLGYYYLPDFQGEWDRTKEYPPLSVVEAPEGLEGVTPGDSYTALDWVPVGTPLTDTTYWAKTGNYNAQIEALKQALADETTNRINADNTLQMQINDETTNRMNADKTLQVQINDEATNRVNADNALQVQINEIKQTPPKLAGGVFERFALQGTYYNPFTAINELVSPISGYSSFGYSYADVAKGTVKFELQFTVGESGVAANTPFLQTPFNYPSNFGSTINLGYLIKRASGSLNQIVLAQCDLHNDGSISSSTAMTSGQIWIIDGETSMLSTFQQAHSLVGYRNLDELRNKVTIFFTTEQEHFDYNNAQPGSLYPTVSGYSDCAAWIWHAYSAGLGWKLNSTISDTLACNGFKIGTYAPTQPIPLNVLRPADVISYSNDNGSTFFHNVLYLGDGKYAEMTSAFGNVKGPISFDLNLEQRTYNEITTYGDLPFTRVVTRLIV